MKKRTLAALLTASAVLSACGAPAEPQPGESDAVIYYLLPAEEAQGGDRIAASWEDLALPEGADDLTEARAVVARLLEGSSDGMMLSPMPEGVELLDLELRDRTAYVDLSGEIRDLSGVELALADYCLT